MSYRYMRMLLFFDLPTITEANKKAYRHFHKFLIKEGFIMLQYSVYMKLTLNPTATQAMLSKIKKSKPIEGSIMVLNITEKQFSNMEIILGSIKTNVLNSTDRVVFYE